MTRHELADAMIRGKAARGVVESLHHYITPKEYGGRTFPKDVPPDTLCAVCALGAAVVGVYGDYVRAFNAFHQARKTQGEYDSFAELLNVSPALAVEIELRHLNDESIEQIAAWLKSSEGGEDVQ